MFIVGAHYDTKVGMDNWHDQVLPGLPAPERREPMTTLPA